MTEKLFPPNFFWGAATASHQVEGNTRNNWSEWEHSEKRMDDLRKQGKNPEEFFSGQNSDHYHHFREDFQLAKDLGHNAHRFSIEWSRIEPEEGVFDQKEIEHYREVLRTLRDLKLEPFITLWHWTVPVWFEQKGGWENADSPKYFERYTQKIMEELGSLGSFWITLNEPLVYSGMSFLDGIWPPQKKSKFRFFRVLLRLLSAHKKAYRVIKAHQKTAQVGTAQHIIFFDDREENFFFRLKMRLKHFCWNTLFVRLMGKMQDFLGVNLYFREGKAPSTPAPRSDLDWELFPEALSLAMKKMARLGIPMVITEHGLADAQDQFRKEYIEESLHHLQKLIAEGVDIRGYLHWSLLDNFEWAEGYAPRFGLIEVDYATQKRTPRQSAIFLREYIQNLPSEK